MPRTLPLHLPRPAASRRSRRRAAVAALLAVLLAAPAIAQEPYIAVACSDYVTGALGALDSAAPWTGHADLASIHADAVLTCHGGLVYVVNRLGADNVQVVDPSQDWETVRQFSAGTSSNPQCLVLSPDGAKAYLPRQERDDVLVVDPGTGGELGVVDLSAWADADGSCEVGQAVLAGERLLVAIQRLDRDYYWLPVGDSYLAVIDTATDQLVDANPAQPGVQAVPLQCANPAWELTLGDDGLVYACCAGIYGLADGGLERVDPLAMASLGPVVTEAALGGDVNAVALVDAHTAYAVVSDAGFNTALVRFDPSTGGGASTVLAGSGYVYTDVEVDASGDLYLADQTLGASGVRVLDAATGAPLAGPVSLGLPPCDLDVPAGPTAAPAPPAALAARLSASPNPFNPRTILAWEGLPAGPARLDIFDARGRRVARRDLGAQGGAGGASWSGRGANGQSLPAGVYQARVAAGGRAAACRLVLLK
ncbi:MAG: hypothetical protein JW819_12700 [Candidatus Krumholzibacteriota bacterium]|nr:hypothetical protein [Candidatus Krumholzibacteriota bacterium]